MNKKHFYILLVLTLLLVSGCAETEPDDAYSDRTAEEPEDVYNYRTTGDDIVPSFYLVKTEYYSDEVVIYYDGTVDISENYSFSNDLEAKGNTLTLKTDNPSEFNSFDMSCGDFSYSFRYLDSDQYACIYTVMDSEGGLDYSGSVDRYYTEEEKNEQNERAHEREEQQKELFERLEGTWTSGDGDYFRIYSEDNYAVEYSLSDRNGMESPVYFDEYLFANENRISISYIDGSCEAMFSIILAEDGSSFEYDGEIFVRVE